MINKIKTISLDDREKAFWFLATVSLLSLGVYIYAINAAAHHIAVRQNLERGVVELNDRIATLEFKAIELRNAITMETAETLGFKEVEERLYVSRGNNSLTFQSVTR